MADFIILIFFVVTLNMYGFNFAMLWTMVVAACSIIVEYLLGHKLQPLQWLAYSTIFLFGVPSLLWHNPLIFQHKITILYSFFALSLFVYPYFYSGTLVEIFFPGLFLEQSCLWVNRWFIFIFINGAIMNNAAIQMLTVEQWGIFKIFLIAGVTVFMGLVFYYFITQKINHDQKTRHPEKKEKE